jgi:putative transposase
LPKSKSGATSGGPADRIVAARGGRLVEQAIEAKAAEINRQYQELKDERDRQRVVRNGDLPERAIQTGIGEVAVRARGLSIMSESAFQTGHVHETQ